MTASAIARIHRFAQFPAVGRERPKKSWKVSRMPMNLKADRLPTEAGRIAIQRGQYTPRKCDGTSQMSRLVRI
jgi:tRNA A-37 threonylcarbamoyl transferase component Bud32